MDHQKGRPGGRPAHTRGESRESYCSLASSASPEVAAAWALYSSAVSLPSASASAASKTWVSAGTVATSALLRLPSLSTSRSAQVTCLGSAVGAVACGDVEIGRAHVCTPVTNAHIVCRLLLEKKKKGILYNK